jgi:hypothetical protein
LRFCRLNPLAQVLLPCRNAGFVSEAIYGWPKLHRQKRGGAIRMNGMHCEHWYLYTTDSNDYSQSYHFELAPTPTILQLSLSGYFEFGDQAHVQMGFTHDEYIDSDGVPRHDDYSNIPEYPTLLVINGLTRVDWEISVNDCWADLLFNAFFWDHVNP